MNRAVAKIAAAAPAQVPAECFSHCGAKNPAAAQRKP